MSPLTFGISSPAPDRQEYSNERHHINLVDKLRLPFHALRKADLMAKASRMLKLKMG